MIVTDGDTTIAYDLTAIELAIVRVSRRIAYETSDRTAAAKACSTLDDIVAWLENEAERQR